MRNIEEHQHAEHRHGHGHNGPVQALSQPENGRKGNQHGQALQDERLADEIHAPIQLIDPVQNIDHQAHALEDEIERNGQQSIEGACRQRVGDAGDEGAGQRDEAKPKYSSVPFSRLMSETW